MKFAKQERIEDEKLLAYVRTLPCSVQGCSGECVSAHLRKQTDGGMSKKPSDVFTNPLCDEHHKLQHQIGEPRFWAGVLAKSGFFMFECIKALCVLRSAGWYAKQGRTDEALELLRRFS